MKKITTIISLFLASNYAYGETIIESRMIQGFQISASDLCIDGKNLRTKSSVKFTKIVREGGDCEEQTESGIEICFTEPTTRRVTVFEGFLTTPIRFNYEICKIYSGSIESGEGKCLEYETIQGRENLTYQIREVEYSRNDIEIEFSSTRHRIPQCDR